jgi:LAO/AO transport system kinase
MTSPAATPNNTELLTKGILGADRSILAKAITLTESTRSVDRLASEQLLKSVMPHTGKSIRIGITGVPGVGKSTFIEALGELLTREDKKVAVLAIDPSSQKTKGSILGDKTRMEQLSRNPRVFIRPTPTSQALGGVSNRTRETILLCEAAGFDVILVETVGVGQSETEVRGMVDFFLLLLLAGAGDELQGMKKGIMEMADGVVINKCDGDNVRAARQALADVTNALHLQAASSSGWTPRVLTVSAIEGKGIQECWDMILGYEQHSKDSAHWDELRASQRRQWLDDSILQYFREWTNDPAMSDKKEQLLQLVMSGTQLPSEAAREFWRVLIQQQTRS